MGERRRGGERVGVVHGKLAGARSASSTNPQSASGAEFGLDSWGPVSTAGGDESTHWHDTDKAFKDRAVARLLPPESAALDDVSRDVGIGVDTLERWRSESMSKPGRDRLDGGGAV